MVVRSMSAAPGSRSRRRTRVLRSPRSRCSERAWTEEGEHQVRSLLPSLKLIDQEAMCSHNQEVTHWYNWAQVALTQALATLDAVRASEADVARQLSACGDENVRLERLIFAANGRAHGWRSAAENDRRQYVAISDQLDAALKMLTEAQLDARSNERERIDLRIQVREQKARIAALESALHRHHACGGEPRDCGICAAWVPEGRKLDGA